MSAVLPTAPGASAEAMSPPVPVRRRGLWAWPFVVALAFAAGVASWLEWTDRREVEETQQTLLTDALTLQTAIGNAVEDEQAALQKLADALPQDADNATLLRQAAVAEGLRRLWVSVTLLDAGNRILAHVPPDQPHPTALPTTAPRGGSSSSSGLTAHLSVPLPAGGRLVVRIAPTTLLRSAVPWWLARQYAIRLVDGFGQLVAASDETPPAPGAPDAFGAASPTYRVSLEPTLVDTYLELAARNAHVPWWRTLPLPLLLAFLLLSAAVTGALRQRMREAASAEARWRDEAAFRRSIEDSLTVGLRARDLEGRIVHVNRAFCDLVGFGPEELLGRLPPMPYWQPDEVDESMARHLRNMSGGAPREGYEARWRHKDGRAIDVMIIDTPLIDAAGRQTGWMGSIIDVTARRRAEERERRQLELLANQSRLTTLGEVASALAHQLNQPLAAIAGYHAGLQRALAGPQAPPLPARVLEALARLGEQAGEAGLIVQRIRAFVTRRAPQPEPCALPALFERVIGMLRRDLQAASVDVRVKVPDDLPRVLADPVLVEQVLINLLRNAIDEFVAHGVAAPTIVVTAHAAGTRFVRIDVDDNGPGLGGRGIDTLATPFHSDKLDGMGMGLAICRSVVEAHHGGMEAGASPLGGARLSFTLPRVDEDAP